MAKFSLRRYDNQAQVSVLLSLVSLLPLAAMTAIMVRLLMSRSDFTEFVFYYGPRARMAVLFCGLASMFLATCGFGFGLNSAGQRRNEKQQLSWIGFFTGALVLALTFVMVFIFMRRGEAIIL